jgi:transposase
VATDLLGAAGRAIWRALRAGARDGAVLAELAQGGLRHKRAQLAAALTGRFTAQHAARRGEVLAPIAYVEATSARLSERMAAGLEPDQEQVARWQGMPGVNREAAEVLLAEMGVDRSRCPSAAQLASWAGRCPGNHESAGKRKTGRTRKGNPWLKTLGVACGGGAGRARRPSLGAQYPRVLRRRGGKKAALAVGHSILVAAYHRGRDGVPDRDRGPEPCDRLSTARLTRHYVHRLAQLGHHVTLQTPDVAQGILAYWGTSEGSTSFLSP